MLLSQIRNRVFNKFLHISRCIYRESWNKHWNIFKLKMLGVKIGKAPNVIGSIYLDIHPQSLVSIGDDFFLSSGDGYNPLSRNIRACIHTKTANASIQIGNSVGISSGVLRSSLSIRIGNFVKIGADCILMDTDAHNLDWRIRSSTEMHDSNITMDTYTAKCAPIIIEDHVLIGTRCIVLKGVTIGARSIIAAGSVVTKSIPSDCIAGGNPCRVIRFMNGISE